MDSRASTRTLTASKPKSFIIDTNHPSMVSTLSSSPPFSTFRPSPLNPKSLPSPSDKPSFPQKRNPLFPASRPLRPFPSIVHAISSPKQDAGLCEDGTLTADAATPVPAAKRTPKTIEISSKWRGGFFVLGMTQAEFSRQD